MFIYFLWFVRYCCFLFINIIIIVYIEVDILHYYCETSPDISIPGNGHLTHGL